MHGNIHVLWMKDYILLNLPGKQNSEKQECFTEVWDSVTNQWYLACYDFFIASLHLQQDVSFWVILLLLASLPIDLAKLITNTPESLGSNDICFSTEIVTHVWWISLEWWNERKGEKKISGINLFGGIVEAGTREKSGTIFLWAHPSKFMPTAALSGAFLFWITGIWRYLSRICFLSWRGKKRESKPSSFWITTRAGAPAGSLSPLRGAHDGCTPNFGTLV